jgi:hypothetical protein
VVASYYHNDHEFIKRAQRVSAARRAQIGAMFIITVVMLTEAIKLLLN